MNWTANRRYRPRLERCFHLSRKSSVFASMSSVLFGCIPFLWDIGMFSIYSDQAVLIFHSKFSQIALSRKTYLGRRWQSAYLHPFFCNEGLQDLVSGDLYPRVGLPNGPLCCLQLERTAKGVKGVGFDDIIAANECNWRGGQKSALIVGMSPCEEAVVVRDPHDFFLESNESSFSFSID